MSYTALYRKFRPACFDEVKGQDHIVTTLKNQIQSDRIGHAYLFCGTRGTGKTTVAKIFAKAVNCQHPKDGEPCGACSVCKSIGDGTSLDVIEIDAASNNGVDNIRDIKDQVRYSPSDGRYKVYIIDEVHMLSIGAFNALLKTLEEPPEYVIFILATTEVHKIPITILSRCQRYDFHRITAGVIEKQLKDLMAQEGVDAQDDALAYLARMADGSMRDALSLLDQCIAFYLGEQLTYERVLDVLGTVDTAVFARLLEGIQDSDVSGMIQCLDEISEQGRELTQFISDFIWYLRNLLLAGNSKAAKEALDMSESQMEQMCQTAEKIGEDTLIRYIRVLSQLQNEMRFASSKRVLAEVALIKMCKPQMETDHLSVLDRVRQLEDQLEKLKQAGLQTPQTAAQVQPADAIVPSDEKQEEEKLHEKFPPAKVQELKEIVEGWRELKRSLPVVSRDFLKQGRLTVNEETTSLRLLFPPDGNLAKMYFEQEPERIQQLEKALEQKVKREIKIEVGDMSDDQNGKHDFVNLDCIHMEIEIED